MIGFTVVVFTADQHTHTIRRVQRINSGHGMLTIQYNESTANGEVRKTITFNMANVVWWETP